jgi:16S rRNA (cytidine1402-2'-O)-methyltransferase
MADQAFGRFYILATPIGNLEDLPFRAARVLSEVDALACEDTRRTRKLLERHRIKSPEQLFSYREHNEQRAGKQILRLLEEGQTVGLCSDAGYPGISDPGYRIVSAAREQGIPIEVLPGAGAVSTALVASGLPSSSYTFLGYPPRKRQARRRFLSQEKDRRHSLILFESPRRIGALLADARDVLGNRMAAVCIELTKKFEEVSRGYLGELVNQYHDQQVKGEVSLVIAGNNPKFLKG